MLIIFKQIYLSQRWLHTLQSSQAKLDAPELNWMQFSDMPKIAFFCGLVWFNGISTIVGY